MDMNRPDYNLSQNEVLERYSTFRTGLSPEEARNRLERYGENKLAEGRKKTALEVFIDQFKDLIVWILIAAAVISILSGQGESSLVIFAVLILNAVLGAVPQGGKIPGIPQGHEFPVRHPASGRHQGAGALAGSCAR